jgi:hypothetical protein
MSPARGANAVLAVALACATAWQVPACAAAAPAAPAPPAPPTAPVARAAPLAPAAPATPASTAPPAIAVWLAGGAPSPSTSPPGQNRPLSAGEARQLQRLRQAARRWQAGLAPLAAAATSQGDAALLADLARLDALLRSLAWAQQLTLASYAAALRASSDALALWRTDAAYVEPAEQQAWQEADAGAVELTTAAETGFVFGIDLGSGQTWSYTEGGAAGGAPGDSGAPGDAAAAEDAGEAAAWVGGDRDASAATVAGAEAAGDMSIDPGQSGESGAGASLSAEAPAYDLGDLQGFPEADSEPALDEAVPPFSWEEICRPWQPAGSASGLGREQASARGAVLEPASACPVSPPR